MPRPTARDAAAAIEKQATVVSARGLEATSEAVLEDGPAALDRRVIAPPVARAIRTTPRSHLSLWCSVRTMAACDSVAVRPADSRRGVSLRWWSQGPAKGCTGPRRIFCERSRARGRPGAWEMLAGHSWDHVANTIYRDSHAKLRARLFRRTRYVGHPRLAAGGRLRRPCVYVDLGQPCEDRQAMLDKAGSAGPGRPASSTPRKSCAATSPFRCCNGRPNTRASICWARRSPGR